MLVDLACLRGTGEACSMMGYTFNSFSIGSCGIFRKYLAPSCSKGTFHPSVSINCSPRFPCPSWKKEAKSLTFTPWDLA